MLQAESVDEVVKLMKHHNLDVLFLQETHRAPYRYPDPTNKEQKKDPIKHPYFIQTGECCAENGSLGVGFVIRRELQPKCQGISSGFKKHDGKPS